MCVYISEISAVDEVAALYRDLESLSEELSGAMQSTIQVSAIAQKVVSCCDRCYSAFIRLGKERKEHEQSLQNEQASGRNQGKLESYFSYRYQLVIHHLYS